MSHRSSSRARSLEWFLMYPQAFEQMRAALRAWVELTDLQWETLAAIVPRARS